MALTFLGTIEEKLEDFLITKRDLKGKEISKRIFEHLKNKGLKVTNHKQIGFLKFHIDIDYKDGNAGVEIILADKLVNDTGNNSEIQKLFGQTYYYTKNYKDIVNVVMILVIGEKYLEKDPRIKEIKKHIEALGATFKYFSTKD